MDPQPTMLELHQFRRAWDIPNPSPFCIKVECFLRMAGIAHRVVEIDMPRAGPKGKAPWIVDGEVRLGDSTLLIRYLQHSRGIDLDAALSAQQRALSHAVSVMLDEHLYWALVYSRWVDARHWPALRDQFFGALPPLLRGVVPPLARRQVRDQLYKHGMGRHGEDEIYALGCADLQALAALLGDGPYLHGDTPTLVDASVFAYVLCIERPPFDSPLKSEVQRHPQLIAHSERMLRTCFPEFA